MHCNALHWPEWICSSQALSVPRGQKPSVTTIIITGGTLAKRNCHQMSPDVISCHQMSSDVIRCRWRSSESDDQMSSGWFTLFLECVVFNDEKSPPSSLQVGHWPRKAFSDVIMMYGIIKVHQMQLDNDNDKKSPIPKAFNYFKCEYIVKTTKIQLLIQAPQSTLLHMWR